MVLAAAKLRLVTARLAVLALAPRRFEAVGVTQLPRARFEVLAPVALAQYVTELAAEVVTQLADAKHVVLAHVASFRLQLRCCITWRWNGFRGFVSCMCDRACGRKLCGTGRWWCFHSRTQLVDASPAVLAHVVELGAAVAALPADLRRAVLLQLSLPCCCLLHGFQMHSSMPARRLGSWHLLHVMLRACSACGCMCGLRLHGLLHRGLLLRCSNVAGGCGAGQLSVAHEAAALELLAWLRSRHLRSACAGTPHNCTKHALG